MAAIALREVPRDELLNTRRKIIVTLKQNGEATAAALAESLFVTVSAIRQHLGRLASEGLIGYREIGRGPGRRRRLYSLTATADVLFPNGYESMARRLADFVAGRAPELLDQFFQQEAAGQVAEIAAGTDGRMDAVLGLMVSLFERNDFAPQLSSPHGDGDGAGGDPLLTLFHCPILALSRDHPQICAYEARAIHDMAMAGQPGGGIDVERRAWRLEGQLLCSYAIRPTKDDD
ncbi:MAG: winged helix-turn-helix transcriptional regulator [Chloroflexi bacterium]|nr:winged helix-turn-helix transcriptional regulator [Chloroflexota bacterium]